MKKRTPLVELEKLEIEPLSDEILASLGGAAEFSPECCSTEACSDGGGEPPPVDSGGWFD
jgi:hypothetical protein